MRQSVLLANQHDDNCIELLLRSGNNLASTSEAQPLYYLVAYERLEFCRNRFLSHAYVSKNSKMSTRSYLTLSAMHSKAIK